MGSEKREMTSREKIEKIRDILKNVDVYDKDEIKEVIDHVELCEIYEDMTTINTYLTEILEIIKEDPVAAADGSEISDEEAIEYLKILEKRMFDISGSAWLGDIPVGVIEKGITAIKELQTFREKDEPGQVRYEGDGIIKALEQEPCEDCVSRKALIERINHAEGKFKADNMESIGSDDGDPFVDGVLSGVFNIREMVIQAPSVTPQEPFMVEIDLYSVIKRKYIEREVLDKIINIVDEWQSDTWTDNLSHECMAKIAELVDSQKSEDKE